MHTVLYIVLSRIFQVIGIGRISLLFSSASCQTLRTSADQCVLLSWSFGLRTEFFPQSSYSKRGRWRHSSSSDLFFLAMFVNVRLCISIASSQTAEVMQMRRFLRERVHIKVFITTDSRSWYNPLTPRAFCQKRIFGGIFSLDMGQISSSQISSSLLKHDNVFLSSSVAFYDMFAWAFAEINVDFSW